MLGSIGNWLLSGENQNLIFESGDKLWRSIQDNFIKFIKDHGGNAVKYSTPDFQLRPNYDIIKKYLRKEISRDQLKQMMGC